MHIHSLNALFASNFVLELRALIRKKSAHHDIGEISVRDDDCSSYSLQSEASGMTGDLEARPSQQVVPVRSNEVNLKEPGALFIFSAPAIYSLIPYGSRTIPLHGLVLDKARG